MLDSPTVETLPQERCKEMPPVPLERRELCEVWLYIEANFCPPQTVRIGPFLKIVHASRGLGSVVRIEIEPLLFGKHDPGDSRNPLLIQKTHSLRSFRREIENGNSNFSMQIAQGRDDTGIAEQRSHLRDSLVTTGE